MCGQGVAACTLDEMKLEIKDRYRLANCKQVPIWGRLSRRKALIDYSWGSQQLISAINDLVSLSLQGG